jgi:hypothetical protein
MGAGGQLDACSQQLTARHLPHSHKLITSGTPFSDGSLGARIYTVALNLAGCLLLPSSGFAKLRLRIVAIEGKDLC